MAALDRYERHYLTKRRRAVDKLEGRRETTNKATLKEGVDFSENEPNSS